ncbi:hypothetical protein PV10_00377 [Exophiala mesophila]|uniref:Chitin synthase activator n=1 Tax=Exophiala mesophila TaxID=212818 RepID=A0A0D1X442_EXOME|nr:uncharacterized protein PV10_00377 [Exophiala mesophila]KIV96525.1 hypothetical protein PV10_00377 [Exophiala mesophila]
MSYNTGATFIPGGEDNYYIPEIVQPTPNRVHEQPQNIQHNVAQLEHAASSPDSAYSGSVYSPQSAHTSSNMYTQWPQSQHDQLYQQPPAQQHYDNRGYATPLTSPQAQSHSQPQSQPRLQHPQYTQPPSQSYQQDAFPPRQSSAAVVEQPNFSPFPVIRNPPPNIPPTDEQKEATLEASRAAVLSCNDPETQLLWAQDALNYVEICQQNEQRQALAQPARAMTPRIEHVLREDAVKVVSFLADQHHPRAEFMRSMWLEFGKFGHRIDKKEAFLGYSRASERGYARADYRIGMQFESSNDALKAIKYYQQGVDKGDSASCYRLGMMTLLGQHGQVQDYERGLNLIYMAAQTADENAPQGAYVLGMLQAHEMPQVSIPEAYLPKDIANARINIEKAAFLGFAKAQVRLGAAYELCELECPFDPALSLHYNALAARQGEAEAEMAISKWFLCGHEGLFEKNEEMAFVYAQRAALSGLSTAQFALGYYYEVGIYVPVNFEQAKDWYRKASQGGNSDAAGRVEAISRSKTLSRKDHEKVALSKIRQQRAATTGRPTDTPTPSLPSLNEVNEPLLDMPDPSRLSINDQRLSPRPGSTAPYPTGKPSMPHPEIRPTSAFGINPNLRTASAQSMGSGRQDPYSYNQMPPQQRPYADNDGYGRGSRMPSAGYNQSHEGGPQVRPPNRTNAGSPYLNQQNTPPLPGKVNIGYTAPLEPERKPRPMHPNGGQPPSNPSSRNSSRPNQPPQGGQGPPRPASSNQQRPSQGSFNQSNRPQPGRAPNQYPPQNVQPAKMAPSKPSPHAPASNAPQSKPAAVPAAAAPVRPPGKGPKTFDEMGVPQGKDKGDCRVM